MTCEVGLMMKRRCTSEKFSHFINTILRLSWRQPRSTICKLSRKSFRLATMHGSSANWESLRSDFRLWTILQWVRAETSHYAKLLFLEAFSSSVRQLIGSLWDDIKANDSINQHVFVLLNIIRPLIIDNNKWLIL